MSKSGIIGFLFLFGTFCLLCYQGIIAALGMEKAGEFIYKNLRLVDVLDGKYFNWIDSLQSIFVTSVAEFLITVPLFLFLLCFATIFFLIQAFKRVK